MGENSSHKIWSFVIHFNPNLLNFFFFDNSDVEINVHRFNYILIKKRGSFGPVCFVKIDPTQIGAWLSISIKVYLGMKILNSLVYQI